MNLTGWRASLLFTVLVVSCAGVALYQTWGFMFAMGEAETAVGLGVGALLIVTLLGAAGLGIGALGSWSPLADLLCDPAGERSLRASHCRPLLLAKRCGLMEKHAERNLLYRSVRMGIHPPARTPRTHSTLVIRFATPAAQTGTN
jgi:hypothetical protein